MMNKNSDSIIENITHESLEAVKRARREDYDRTRILLIDIIAVGSAGFRLDPKPRKLQELFGSSKGSCTLFGAWSTTNILAAAVINSFSSHVLELDDWLAPGLIHAGASVVPSVIALAEKEGKTLEETLEAIMLGYELAGRVGLLLGKKHYKYWHTTSTAGGVGVASAISYLIHGNDVENISRAASVAAAYSGGLWGIIGREVAIKPLSTAHAAFLGVSSSSLSIFVPPGNKRVFETERGICNVMNGECNIDEAMSPPWRIAVEVVSNKIFPASRNTHTVIQAALKLAGKVDLGRIKSITIEVFEEAYQVADIIGPITVDEAKFSLTFLASLSLTRGWNSIYDLKKALSDPLVRELEKKIRLKIREDFTAMYPEKQPARIIIDLNDGNRIEAYEEIPIGDPAHPLGAENILKKARLLAIESKDDIMLRIIEILKNPSMSESIREIFASSIQDKQVISPKPS